MKIRINFEAGYLIAYVFVCRITRIDVSKTKSPSGRGAPGGVTAIYVTPLGRLGDRIDTFVVHLHLSPITHRPRNQTREAEEEAHHADEIREPAQQASHGVDCTGAHLPRTRRNERPRPPGVGWGQKEKPTAIGRGRSGACGSTSGGGGQPNMSLTVSRSLTSSSLVAASLDLAKSSIS